MLERKAALRYEELRVGLTRYYQARQNQVQVEKVIRVAIPGVVQLFSGLVVEVRYAAGDEPRIFPVRGLIVPGDVQIVLDVPQQPSPVQ